MYKVILENIVRLMNRKNLTQQELADKASISRVRVNQLLSQRRNFNPKLSTLVNIARALDMDFIELSKVKSIILCKILYNVLPVSH